MPDRNKPKPGDLVWVKGIVLSSPNVYGEIVVAIDRTRPVSGDLPPLLDMYPQDVHSREGE